MSFFFFCTLRFIRKYFCQASWFATCWYSLFQTLSPSLPPLRWLGVCYVTHACNTSSSQADYPYRRGDFLATSQTVWIWVALRKSPGSCPTFWKLWAPPADVEDLHCIFHILWSMNFHHFDEGADRLDIFNTVSNPKGSKLKFAQYGAFLCQMTAITLSSFYWYIFKGLFG